MEKNYPNVKVPNWYKKVIELCFSYHSGNFLENYKQGLLYKNNYTKKNIGNIYKYTHLRGNAASVNADVRNLLNGNISLKSPLTFNDPFDYCYLLPEPQRHASAVQKRLDDLQKIQESLYPIN